MLLSNTIYKKGYSKLSSHIRRPDAVERVGQLDPSGGTKHKHILMSHKMLLQKAHETQIRHDHLNKMWQIHKINFNNALHTDIWFSIV